MRPGILYLRQALPLTREYYSTRLNPGLVAKLKIGSTEQVHPVLTDRARGKHTSLR